MYEIRQVSICFVQTCLFFSLFVNRGILLYPMLTILLPPSIPLSLSLRVVTGHLTANNVTAISSNSFKYCLHKIHLREKKATIKRITISTAMMMMTVSRRQRWWYPTHAFIHTHTHSNTLWRGNGLNFVKSCTKKRVMCIQGKTWSGISKIWAGMSLRYQSKATTKTIKRTMNLIWWQIWNFLKVSLFLLSSFKPSVRHRFNSFLPHTIAIHCFISSHTYTNMLYQNIRI